MRTPPVVDVPRRAVLAACAVYYVTVWSDGHHLLLPLHIHSMLLSQTHLGGGRVGSASPEHEPMHDLFGDPVVRPHMAPRRELHGDEAMYDAVLNAPARATVEAQFGQPIVTQYGGQPSQPPPTVSPCDDDERRPWYKLSLPGTQEYPAFVKPARDVLQHWPDEYDATLDTQAWGNAMKWQTARRSVLADTGFLDATVNYAYNHLFPYIPSGRRGHVMLYDCSNERQAEAKKRNFYAMLQYVKHYPVEANMKKDLGISQSTFYDQVMPCLLSCARGVDYLDWQLRLWDWNHPEHVPERILTSWDGLPIPVCASGNKWVKRLTKSAKYGEHVVKLDLGIMLAPGFPIGYTGPHLGVRNDAVMWTGKKGRRIMDARRIHKMYPWEYAFGDKAYIGCSEFVCEYKGAVSDEQRQFNDMLQFYRGRNEHLVREVKDCREALCTRWRGSFLELSAVCRLVVHMVGLQERMKGPRYDVFGPWPVCPDHIVRQYL